MTRIKEARSSILFLIGVLIILAAVITALLRNEAILPGMVILGCTLCGVGVAQANGNGNRKENR